MARKDAETETEVQLLPDKHRAKLGGGREIAQWVGCYLGESEKCQFHPWHPKRHTHKPARSDPEQSQEESLSSARVTPKPNNYNLGKI